ncbi:small subunit ribosomal protein S20 [Phyllobacterium sp. 1468]|uniref:30S ribosomal protein S20 n=1 Tax=Phyllobacterium sp. 1468 TaxID=2817759 RepID=UPI001AE31B89|nr:30S ribosomal protein S20 [Phyllobacterium sp. 1468]MDR6633233.1 small subunit ribosomal protein S20 [Phyllobacterium sp. 1468]
MANTPSAKKAARKIEARTEVNKSRRSRVRTFLRKFEDAVASGDQEAASIAFKAVEPEVMRAASKGVFHKNTASRKVSRLSARLKSMSA